MQKAILMAQVCLYVAVLMPFFSDQILKLRGLAVGAQGWLLALVGPIGCVALCEICKLLTKMQKRQYQEDLAMRQAAEASGARAVQRQHSQAPTKVKSSVKLAAPREVDASPAKPPAKKGMQKKGVAQ